MTELDQSDPGAPAPMDGRRLRLVLGALLLGMLLAAIDQTIVGTVLPTIVGELGGLSHLSWVVSGYLLAETASTPLWGKLGDLYGRKRFFQIAIVVFVAGSALSGISQNLVQLIAFRAVQGVGAGGLIVGAQAGIADVVPPRQRGRYQGLFGAVFGVASVFGPLLGGFLVDSLSWRWVFFVNVPLGVIALVVTSVALPDLAKRTHQMIDYLGTVLVAAAITALVVLTSVGGATVPWVSLLTVLLGLAAAALIVTFVKVERHAAEPVLPMRLFVDRVFATASAIGFLVGFSLFGALTFMPIYLQVVRGIDPTASGLAMLPMIAGLLTGSVGSGRLISRTGRYKIFPVVGGAAMTVGMFLLSRLGAGSSTLQTSVSLVVLGLGVGLVMPVLVIAVQSSVDFTDLGVTTSAVTFFRSIGASFGVAVFGAIFNSRLSVNLAERLAGQSLPPGVTARGGAPAAIAQLPPPLHDAVVHAYAASIHTVFLVVVPIMAVAFVLAWRLPELTLKETSRAPDPAQSLAPTAYPATASSLDELARALSMLMSRESRLDALGRLATRAGLDLTPRQAGAVLRLAKYEGATTSEIAEQVKAPLDALTAVVGSLVAQGLATIDGNRPVLTDEGRAVLDRLLTARREHLAQLLEGWTPDEHAEVVDLVHRLSLELIQDDSPDSLLAAARSQRT